MNIRDLARPEIRNLVPYSAPAAPESFTRLNANEAPTFPYGGISTVDRNRYPQMRPTTLQGRLADVYGVRAAMLCPTRGSSEGIDLLIRTFCRAYTDNIVVLPPTFEMYAAYAEMHGAEVRRAPLVPDTFAVDWKLLRLQCDASTKIVFLCSPNTPTGNPIPASDIVSFAKQRAGRTLVVIDEAYIEFSGEDSMVSLIGENPNLVVLRTLSKAYALAGARCGAVIGHEDLATLVAAMVSPYAMSTPVTDLVLDALQERGMEFAKRQIENIVRERSRLEKALKACPDVEKVWPSSANFILLRFRMPDRIAALLEENRILIRQFTGSPELEGCTRITVGTADETDQLLAALRTSGGIR